MADTTTEPSPIRHASQRLTAVAFSILILGAVLRVLASQGELWLDEMWSLLNVGATTSPAEIFTTIKHDNNHLLNTLWMWTLGPFQSSFSYRLPSLILSVILLVVLFREWRVQSERKGYLVWYTLVAASYPIILYSTEARGYSLALLMTVVAYRSLNRMLNSPQDTQALLTFSVAGIVGCLAHAIYALFLAPAIVWLVYCVATSRDRLPSRRILRLGVIPPLLIAILLTFTFYKGMEIGGAPRFPYLEVAASTISVSFGGEPLSAMSPEVTGWSAFLALFIVVILGIELSKWLASKDPLAVLVGLILVTPWLAVWALQPHFILPRYFLVQILFAYLLLARFLTRLSSQGRLGAGIAVILTLLVVGANCRHTLQLYAFGRSHFKEIFNQIASERSAAASTTVGGDQDFQNSLRLRYAELTPNTTSVLGFAKRPFYPNIFLTYVENYGTSSSSPQYVIRETLDAHEQFPPSFATRAGTTYALVKSYRAPPLSGSHVFLYKRVEG